jgi:hypothetical protein
LKFTEKLTEGSTVAKKHSEARFEDAIEYSLLHEGGLSQGRSQDFDSARALEPAGVLDFIQLTQPKIRQALQAIQGDGAGTLVLDSLCKELDTKQTLGETHGFSSCLITQAKPWSVPYYPDSKVQTGLPGLVIAAERRAQALVHPAEKTDLEGAALRCRGQGVALEYQVGPQPAGVVVAQPGLGAGHALVERLLAILRPLDHRAALRSYENIDHRREAVSRCSRQGTRQMCVARPQSLGLARATH